MRSDDLDSVPRGQWPAHARRARMCNIRSKNERKMSWKEMKLIIARYKLDESILRQRKPKRSMKNQSIDEQGHSPTYHKKDNQCEIRLLRKV